MLTRHSTMDRIPTNSEILRPLRYSSFSSVVGAVGVEEVVPSVMTSSVLPVCPEKSL